MFVLLAALVAVATLAPGQAAADQPLLTRCNTYDREVASVDLRADVQRSLNELEKAQDGLDLVRRLQSDLNSTSEFGFVSTEDALAILLFVYPLKATATLFNNLVALGRILNEVQAVVLYTAERAAEGATSGDISRELVALRTLALKSLATQGVVAAQDLAADIALMKELVDGDNWYDRHREASLMRLRELNRHYSVQFTRAFSNLKAIGGVRQGFDSYCGSPPQWISDLQIPNASSIREAVHMIRALVVPDIPLPHQLPQEAHEAFSIWLEARRSEETGQTSPAPPDLLQP